MPGEMMSEEIAPAVVEPVESAVDPKLAEPILIDQFEGEFVRQFEGKLPAITMTMPEGYARGTHLKLMVEVRVRNVRYEEKGKSNELARNHQFALEDITLIGAYHPDELDPGVGGSAAAGADLDDDPDQLSLDEVSDEFTSAFPDLPEPEHLDTCDVKHPMMDFVCTQEEGHNGMHANGSVVGALW